LRITIFNCSEMTNRRCSEIRAKSDKSSCKKNSSVWNKILFNEFLRKSLFWKLGN